MVVRHRGYGSLETMVIKSLNLVTVKAPLYAVPTILYGPVCTTCCRKRHFLSEEEATTYRLLTHLEDGWCRVATYYRNLNAI